MFLDFPDNAKMECHGTKFHSLQEQPHRALETNLSQWEHMDRRLHCDTAGPHGTQVTIVMHWKLMEPRLHRDKPGADGTKEILSLIHI